MAEQKVAAFEKGKNLIGAGIDRVDGPLKVSGRAPYSYEYKPQQAALYGVAVGATIASGRITSIDISKAETAPGVKLVMTHKNALKQAEWQKGGSSERHAGAKPYLSNDAVRFYGEPVALVVADTFEQATAAAQLVKVSYQADKAEVDFKYRAVEGAKPKSDAESKKPDSSVGNFDKAFTEAPVKIDELYTTPQQNHAMMEPHASLAAFEQGKLTVFAPFQLTVDGHKSVCNTFNMSKDDVRTISRYIGGGFGGKLPANPDTILASAAAMKLKRPVKVALTRQQMFHMTTNRTASMQRVRLGATQDGKLTAIEHASTTHTARFDDFAEPVSPPTRAMYAAPNRRTSQRVVHLDLPISDSMRAPGEAISLLALESAMDELAVKLDMDPIELRRRNEPEQDPEKKVPYSSRHLIGCLDEGAKRFGWNKRQSKPQSVRDGRQFVGMGVAAAIRGNFLRPSHARIRMDRDGKLVAQLAMTDIGTGTYTILTQIAAETLGLSLENIRIELGDSSFPETPGSGGSFGAASSGSGLYDACNKLRKTLADYAVADEKSPLHGAKVEDILFADGRISTGNQSEAIADIVKRNKPDGIEEKGSIKPGLEQKSYSHHAFGAHFVEIGVDMDTGETRLRRMLGVFAAGRILNAKTARSQMIGGMIWGVSSALHEENIVDKRYGSFVNQDLAMYHVPVHADIGEVEAIMLPEIEEHHNPLGIKGIGELGICGAGAAVANAIYNATGVRVRDFPITLDKIMLEMPQNA